MEEKSGGKPLRHSTHKSKDLYEAYMKNTERNIPIQSSDDDVKLQDNDQTNEQGEELNSISPELEDIYLLQISELNDRITALEKERNDFKDQAIRLAAEMDNFRRRTQKEKNELIDYANERLLLQMIQLLDDLNNAVTAGKQTPDAASMISGMEMILQKTTKMFADAGVTPMDDIIGKPFDVHLHEALMVMHSEFPEGTVVQVVLPGFMIKDKVLRHAKVITSSGEPE